MYITHTRPAKLKILFSSTGPTGLHVKKIAVKTKPQEYITKSTSRGSSSALGDGGCNSLILNYTTRRRFTFSKPVKLYYYYRYVYLPPNPIPIHSPPFVYSSNFSVIFPNFKERDETTLYHCSVSVRTSLTHSLNVPPNFLTAKNFKGRRFSLVASLSPWNWLFDFHYASVYVLYGMTQFPPK